MLNIVLTFFLIDPLTGIFAGSISTNLAFGKRASQSSTLVRLEVQSTALLAVDGDEVSASRTELTMNQWWSIDLGGVFFIDRVELYADQTDNFDIWTSLTGSTVSGARPGWKKNAQLTINRSPEVISFLPALARYLAVITNSRSNQGIVLEEVVIFGYEPNSFTQNGTASQSSTHSNYNASFAIDDKVPTISLTASTNQNWWKVDFGQNVLIYRISITLSGIPSKDMPNSINVMTTNSHLSGSPLLEPWILCSVINGSRWWYSLITSCMDELLRPARQLALLANGTLAIHEVDVFGLVPPMMSRLVIANTSSLNCTSISFSFSPWDSTMKGDITPYQYAVGIRKAHDSNQFHYTSVANPLTGQPVYISFDNLDPDTDYQFRVRCDLADVILPEDAEAFLDSITLKTTACSNPGKVTEIPYEYETNSLKSTTTAVAVGSVLGILAVVAVAVAAVAAIIWRKRRLRNNPQSGSLASGWGTNTYHDPSNLNGGKTTADTGIRYVDQANHLKGIDMMRSPKVADETYEEIGEDQPRSDHVYLSLYQLPDDDTQSISISGQQGQGQITEMPASSISLNEPGGEIMVNIMYENICDTAKEFSENIYELSEQ